MLDLNRLYIRVLQISYQCLQNILQFLNVSLGKTMMSLPFLLSLFHTVHTLTAHTLELSGAFVFASSRYVIYLS